MKKTDFDKYKRKYDEFVMPEGDKLRLRRLNTVELLEVEKFAEGDNFKRILALASFSIVGDDDKQLFTPEEFGEYTFPPTVFFDLVKKVDELNQIQVPN